MNIITYGTFDLLHYGHIRLLLRASRMGSRLYVGISTDIFNAQKGKSAFQSFSERCELVSAVRGVHHIFEENSWEQKVGDIARFRIGAFVIGDDWTGRFDYLNEHCKVVYVPRTPIISSSMIRQRLSST